MCLIFMYAWLCKGLPFIGSKPNNIPCLHVQMLYHSIAMCASGRTEFWITYSTKNSVCLLHSQNLNYFKARPISFFMCVASVFFFVLIEAKLNFELNRYGLIFFVQLYDGKFCNCWWIELTVISSTKQSLYCILDLETSIVKLEL